jgi:hypothetical protein
VDPYLSVVVVGRNDDHGVNFLQRMQTCLDCLVGLAERHRLALELVVVEWNPEPGRASLAEAIDWPAMSTTSARVITVPPALHQRLRHCDQLQMFQMIAKNVGIRRARGEFVLATNADLLFSDELVGFLASKPLSRNVLYRIDRTDVPAEIEGETIDQRLRYCADHILRVHTAYGSFVPGRGPGFKRRVKIQLERVMSGARGRPNYFAAFTNGAGDFTLLSRADWDRLRAYPELQQYSLHIDALLCCAALGAGVDVETLPQPMRIFHMEHGHGFGSFSGRKKTNPHLDLALTSTQHRRWCKRLLAGKGLPWAESEGWGFASENLPETVIR